MLFVLPRFIEMLWRMLAKRNLVTKIENWEFLVFGCAMGLINYYYVNNVIFEFRNSRSA